MNRSIVASSTQSIQTTNVIERAWMNPRLAAPMNFLRYGVEGVVLACMTALVASITIAPFLPTVSWQDSSLEMVILSSILVAMLTIMPGWTILQMSSRARSIDQSALNDAKRRVYDLINDGYGIVGNEDLGHFARRVIHNPDGRPFGREMLFRLDDLALELASVQDEVGDDPDMIRRSRAKAHHSAYRLIERYRDANDAHAADRRIERFQRFEALCTSIVPEPIDGTTAIRFAPSARISRILSTAERMLEKHPDLADDHGGRIDDLIRLHVPRLLDRHREAAATAPTEEVEEVDAKLDLAVETVRLSIEEAAGRVHDEAMDALATELRFLSLRRGQGDTSLHAV